MAVRATQYPLELVTDGLPAMRATQYPIEVVTDGLPAMRATQYPIEVIYAASTAAARLTQYSLEIVYRRKPETENCALGALEPSLGLPTDIAF